MSSIEKHIQTLKDPMAWFTYYRQQKLIGDILLESAIKKEELEKIKMDDNSSNFITIFINAHYHWGIAIENGLKGIFVKNKSNEILFNEHNNNITIKNIGGQAGKTHQLLKLTEELGIFETQRQICKCETDCITLKQVLLHLSDVIKWIARYPISHNTATIFKLSENVPHLLVYGFHILDVMQPLFDLFEQEIKDLQEI